MVAAHRRARAGILLALALSAAACRGAPVASAHAPTSVSLTAEAARQRADRLLAAHATGDYTYSFVSVEEHEEEFHVHYARHSPCTRRPTLARGTPEGEEQGDGAGRNFTMQVDVCPSGSSNGTTIIVRKSDGGASFVGSE